MPRLEWSAVESDGARRRGIGQFASIRALEAQARERGAMIIEAKALSESRSGERRLKRAAIEEFTILLSALLESGLGVRDALDAVSGAAARTDVSHLAAELGGYIDSGRTLDGALEDTKMRFPPIYRGLVRVGERTGSIEKTMPRLALHLGAESKLRARIGGALIYPAIVLTVALVGGGAVLIFVLPKLVSIFADSGGAAGDTLRESIGRASGILGVLGGLIAAAVAIGIAAFIARARNQAAALAVDATRLRLPILGPFLRDRETLVFAFAMESLTSGGVPIDEALAECAGVAGNMAFAHEIEAVRLRVRKGLPLSKAFEQATLLPSNLRQWVAVGERTGKVEDVFSQVRCYYQTAVDKATDRIMNLAEPAVMLIVGAFMMAMVFMFIVPIFSAYGSLL